MTEGLLSSVDVLEAYVAGICEAAHASSGTLYVPVGPRGGRPILVHYGDGEPVPELQTLEEAQLLSTRLERPKLGGRPRFVRSGAKDCQIVLMPRDFSNAGYVDGVARYPRRRSSDVAYSLNEPGAWLGLRFSDPGNPLLVGENASDAPLSQTGLERFVLLAGVLAQYSRRVSEALEDPLTGLPARAQFELQLQDALALAHRNHCPVSLILVNPDRFATVNERFGRAQGDKILEAVAERLTKALRSTDVIARYGGSTFAVILGDTGTSSAEVVGKKILSRLETLASLDETLELSFSVGAATVKPSGEEVPAAVLVHRADLALTAAKQVREHRYDAWTPELEAAALGQTDRLNGIFTGNMSKDYRNMALLSDTVNLVATAGGFHELAARVAQRLCTLLKADHVDVFEHTQNVGARLIHSAHRESQNGEPDSPVKAGASSLDTDQQRAQQALLVQTEQSGRAMRVSDIDGGVSPDRISAYAVPLNAGGRHLGWLYIDGDSDRLGLDPGDLIFLESLGAQLAVAFDRARLAEQERARQEEETQRLRVELEDLRKTVDGTQLIYQSDSMKALLVHARRAAQSEATVLVTGQSGTGKELMARAVHRLSRRSAKPPVVVDCASIPTTLIESELFGHERGAYTGAQQRKVGRVVEADRGTLILDEIGELPLEVQSKLLRFVQEKEVVPVGGTKTRKVDARVIAVTNRDLKKESEAGRFREDLYHRLNVVHLHIPPLAERASDVTLLLNHFLEKFSRQYHQGAPRRLSPAAADAVESYPWPGNVRELENRILQAVILSERSEITLDELGLTSRPQESPSARETSSMHPVHAATPDNGPTHASSYDAPLEPGRADEPLEAPTNPDREREKIWSALQGVLADMVNDSLSRSSRRGRNGDGNGGPGPSTESDPAPLGRWLAESIVLEAQKAEGHVMRRAAARIGMPEATFRRRLKKIQKHVEEVSSRPDEWEQVRTLVGQLIRAESEASEDILHRARILLLNDLTHRENHTVATAAALMGVTEPTLRRWTKELR